MRKGYEVWQEIQGKRSDEEGVAEKEALRPGL